MSRRRLALLATAITVASCAGRTEPLREGRGDAGAVFDSSVSDAAGSDASSSDASESDTGGCNQPYEPVALPLPSLGTPEHQVQLRVTSGSIYMRRANPVVGEEIIKFRPGAVREDVLDFGRRLNILDVRGDSVLYASDGLPVMLNWLGPRIGGSFALEPSNVPFQQMFRTPEGWVSHRSLMSETRVAWQTFEGQVWSIDAGRFEPQLRNRRGTGPAPLVNDRFTSYQSLAPNARRIHVLDNPPGASESTFDRRRGIITVALTDDSLYFLQDNQLFVWPSPFDTAPSEVRLPNDEVCDAVQSGGQNIYLVCDSGDSGRTIRRVVGNRTELVVELQAQLRGTDFGERFASFIEVPFGLILGRDSGDAKVVVVDLQTGDRMEVAPLEIVSDGLMDQPRLPAHTEVHDDIVVWYSTQSQAPAAGAVRMEKRCD